MSNLILYTLLCFSIGLCIGYIGGLKRCDEFIQEILNIINSDEKESDEMNIKQAKEIFDIFLQDIETNNEGNYILDLRLNTNGTWSHFTLKDIKAFKMAFKSLEMWETIVKEINILIQGDRGVELIQAGEKRALAIVEKYKKEIEK